MRRSAGLRRASQLSFLGVAAGIYAVAMAVAARLLHLDARADAVAIALTFDLVVVVPLAVYRTGRAPPALPDRDPGPGAS